MFWQRDTQIPMLTIHTADCIHEKVARLIGCSHQRYDFIMSASNGECIWICTVYVEDLYNFITKI